MAVHDRDYYRTDNRPGFSLRSQSVVTKIIIINVAVWFLQILFRDGTVTRFLACTPQDIFGPGFPKLWKLLTAAFAHAETNVMHIAMNMLFLYIAGRDLAEMYGELNFWTLYLVAAVLSVLAEVIALHTSGMNSDATVLGASGAVGAVITVCTLFFPRRMILFMLFLPMPLWLVFVLFLVTDMLGAVSGKATGVAHFAHLAGYAFGFLYKHFDLRWEHLRGLSRRGGPPRPRRRALRKRRRSIEGGADAAPRPDPVSLRIDELLAKISEHGMGSLSDEEREFLVENSRRYRSR